METSTLGGGKFHPYIRLLQFHCIITRANILIGMMISVYLLARKESFAKQSKKILYAILPETPYRRTLRAVAEADRIFSGFVRGRLLDSLIIGILCFICCSIFKFPYTPIISVFVGVTNIIPIFGPFLGAIPSAFLILLVSPKQCLYFILFIIALQQFDGNILGPKILGNSTGLSSFWVLFSILFFGGLFGFVGMIIAVPAFAVIYDLISRAVHRSLRLRKLPMETDEYRKIDHIDEKTGMIMELNKK